MAIRGLLERNLLDRAMNLAERRWPGSGPLVRLSYEWARLPPADRRERLASIGPEELARLRGVAELQPDLARVLDDLEARGIIPRAASLPDEPAPADSLTAGEEQVVDAVLDLAEEQAKQAAGDLEPRLERLREQLSAADIDPDVIPPAPEIPATAGTVSPVSNGSAAAFLAEQAEQRLRATEHANAALERVRATIERSAARVSNRPTAPSPRPSTETRVTQTRAASATSTSEEMAPATHEPSVDLQHRATEIAARLWAERVVTIEGEEARRLAPEVLAAALGTVDATLSPDALGRRAFYGGLVREGRGVVAQPGAFPRALSRPGLTVVRGRLLPSVVQRLREGFCDIPGAKATTRVHPDARILVIAD